MRPVRHVNSAEAISDARQVRATWEHEIRTRARQSPRARFGNLPVAVLRDRLERFSRRYDFSVTEVGFLSPLRRQLAPHIVVRTTHYLALARALPTISTALDPKRRTRDDRTGWRYEGFYFQANDEHGIPFVAIFNFLRGRGPGGGQWARSERLYPFPHL